MDLVWLKVLRNSCTVPYLLNAQLWKIWNHQRSWEKILIGNWSRLGPLFINANIRFCGQQIVWNCPDRNQTEYMWLQTNYSALTANLVRWVTLHLHYTFTCTWYGDSKRLVLMAGLVNLANFPSPGSADLCRSGFVVAERLGTVLGIPLYLLSFVT